MDADDIRMYNRKLIGAYIRLQNRKPTNNLLKLVTLNEKLEITLTQGYKRKYLFGNKKSIHESYEDYARDLDEEHDKVD